jgi:hypothetical protein
MSQPNPQMQNLGNPMPQGEAPPHGMRDIIPYGLSWDEIWPKLLLALMILLACALLYFLWKRYFKKKIKEVVPEDPFVVLESRLAKMHPPEPFEGKSCVQYFFDLNMIFRQFIELTSGVPATDLTLQELKEPLRFKSPLSRDTTEEVIRFLERSENIKFAGFFTDINEAKESHLQVMRWVSYLRPRRIMNEAEHK